MKKQDLQKAGRLNRVTIIKPDKNKYISIATFRKAYDVIDRDIEDVIKTTKIGE